MEAAADDDGAADDAGVRGGVGVDGDGEVGRRALAVRAIAAESVVSVKRESASGFEDQGVVDVVQRLATRVDADGAEVVEGADAVEGERRAAAEGGALKEAEGA